jgi:hypothetical protein
MLSCACQPAFGLIIPGLIVRTIASPYDSIDGGPAVTDALDGSGVGSISVDTLARGGHRVVAIFGGDSTHGTSTGAADHGVRPVANAVGPYEVAEGGSLSMTGAGSTDSVLYGWDLDGDNDFDDSLASTGSLVGPETPCWH